tara:strand:+ start:1760 stop:2140 length:381 start_codon:yes stop_codon:yes gene_type:complete
MANPPDIVSVAHIYGNEQCTKLSTTNATAIMDAVPTNYSHKVNMIIASNIDGTNNCDLNIYIDKDGTAYYLAYTITIPADSSLSLIDTPLYINHNASGTGNRLMAVAQTASDLDIVVSYEAITDVA